MFTKNENFPIYIQILNVIDGRLEKQIDLICLSLGLSALFNPRRPNLLSGSRQSPSLQAAMKPFILLLSQLFPNFYIRVIKHSGTVAILRNSSTELVLK